MNFTQSSSNTSMNALLEQGKHAFLIMSTLTTEQKNQALILLAELLGKAQEQLLEANAVDLAENKSTLDVALYQRLKLDEGKITQLQQGIHQLVKLENPAGKVLATTELDDGLTLTKVSVPLGLIGIIFESRPDVMPQVLSLILKSGNAVVFKGGKEARHTLNAMMQHVIHPLTEQLDYLPQGWATLIESREDVHAMLTFPQYVDLIIPRGSNKLVQTIMESTRIPVLGHADGVCHQYLHPSAEMDQALEVIIDSKIQYPSGCNALETLLVDGDIAPAFLPVFHKRCTAEGITLHACPESLHYLPEAVVATEEDWRTEYGSLDLAVKLVAGLDEAIAHINTYASHHTDGILATDTKAIEIFLNQVDSASVFANASTRFADGFRYGFGAEIGISTARTHARGPVGLEGLVSYKFKLVGKHHVVKDYVGSPPAKMFTHRSL